MEEKKINTGRYNEKTKRQIQAESISEDYPHVRRFFAAVFDIIATEKKPTILIFVNLMELTGETCKR